MNGPRGSARAKRALVVLFNERQLGHLAELGELVARPAPPEVSERGKRELNQARRGLTGYRVFFARPKSGLPPEMTPAIASPSQLFRSTISANAARNSGDVLDAPGTAKSS